MYGMRGLGTTQEVPIDWDSVDWGFDDPSIGDSSIGLPSTGGGGGGGGAVTPGGGAGGGAGITSVLRANSVTVYVIAGALLLMMFAKR